jgi:hypothetical protein
MPRRLLFKRCAFPLKSRLPSIGVHSENFLHFELAVVPVALAGVLLLHV